jgi:hypothetical protein
MSRRIALLTLAALASQHQQPASAQLACPVVDGVCDAAKCAGGFNASDSTSALGTAFGSGAHTVLVKNMGVLLATGGAVNLMAPLSCPMVNHYPTCDDVI